MQYCKDDCFKQGVIVYFVLFFIAFFLAICGLFNFYKVLYKHKRYKNFPLLLFYIFAIATLVCNNIIPSIIYKSHYIIVRVVLFSDIFIGYRADVYNFLIGFPIFTYIATGYC